MITKTVFEDYEIEINMDTRLPDIYLRKAIIKIRNLDKRNRGTVDKWIKRLVTYEFISKSDYNMYRVLDSGKDWSQLET